MLLDTRSVSEKRPFGRDRGLGFDEQDAIRRFEHQIHFGLILIPIEVHAPNEPRSLTGALFEDFRDYPGLEKPTAKRM